MTDTKYRIVPQEDGDYILQRFNTRAPEDFGWLTVKRVGSLEDAKKAVKNLSRETIYFED